MNSDIILSMEKKANKVMHKKEITLIERNTQTNIIWLLASVGFGVNSISKIMNLGQSQVSRLVAKKPSDWEVPTYLL